MNFNELFNEFEQMNVPTYASRIRSLQSFLCEEKQINDGSYRTYLKAMTFDEILEALDYFVKNNNIKKRSVALHYSEMIKKFFDFLLTKGIENKDLFSMRGKSGAGSFDNKIKKHINEDLCLLIPEPNAPLDDDEIGILIDKSNEIIQDSMNNEELLFSNKKLVSFNKYTAAICVKIMIFSGISWDCIKRLELDAINTELNTIMINRFLLHMPIELSKQMKDYVRIRDGVKTESTKLFVRSSGKELGGTCALESVLKEIDREDTRGIIKYTIINMIRANIGQHLIMELTEVGDIVYNHCLSVVNGEGMVENTRIIDSKLRSISIFDLL